MGFSYIIFLWERSIHIHSFCCIFLTLSLSDILPCPSIVGDGANLDRLGTGTLPSSYLPDSQLDTFSNLQSTVSSWLLYIYQFWSPSRRQTNRLDYRAKTKCFTSLCPQHLWAPSLYPTLFLYQPDLCCSVLQQVALTFFIPHRHMVWYRHDVSMFPFATGNNSTSKPPFKLGHLSLF